MQSEVKNYLLSRGKAPLDYVLGKFEDHDIVLLGEMHYIRQQVEFYHRLIPLLPEHGITLFATEFGRREDQALIDELLGKKEFDVALAKRIMLHQEAFWGYRCGRDPVIYALPEDR